MVLLTVFEPPGQVVIPRVTASLPKSPGGGAPSKSIEIVPYSSVSLRNTADPSVKLPLLHANFPALVNVVVILPGSSEATKNSLSTPGDVPNWPPARLKS